MEILVGGKKTIFLLLNCFIVGGPVLIAGRTNEALAHSHKLLFGLYTSRSISPEYANATASQPFVLTCILFISLAGQCLIGAFILLYIVFLQSLGPGCFHRS